MKQGMETNRNSDGWNVPEKYWEMLKESPENFCDIPAEYRSPALCMAAVKAWGYNLESVPEGLKTKEMCREAFEASPDLGYEHCAILAYIPFPDVCLEKLKDNVGRLDMTDLASALRPEVINKEIADFLVGLDGHCLSYIPIHLQTEELAIQAVSVSGNQVLHSRNVREDLKTEKVYLAGMAEDCYQSYLHIPYSKVTPEICLVASKMYPSLFQTRPDMLPAHIKNGCNLYTLNKMLERATGEKYEVEQVKKLYNGGTIQAKSFITPGGTLKNQEVRFNKDKKEFSFQPLKQEKKKGLKI